MGFMRWWVQFGIIIFFGSKQFVLCQKLKELKCSFKVLNRQRFSHVSNRAQQAVVALKQAQLDFHDSPGNLELRSKVDKLTKKARFLSKVER